MLYEPLALYPPLGHAKNSQLPATKPQRQNQGPLNAEKPRLSNVYLQQ